MQKGESGEYAFFRDVEMVEIKGGNIFGYGPIGLCPIQSYTSIQGWAKCSIPESSKNCAHLNL